MFTRRSETRDAADWNADTNWNRGRVREASSHYDATRTRFDNVLRIRQVSRLSHPDVEVPPMREAGEQMKSIPNEYQPVITLLRC